MKEYIAETGGRYTYSDDILNLQDLSLSMSSIFDGCSNFIISGCEISGSEVSPGYVWLNNKVRLFSGCKDAKFPYFIFEKNNYDTVTYANEENKKGRCNYMCIGGTSVPENADLVTKAVPQYIELNISYSPRFIDKFIGKYAVLLDSPFAKQTVKKDIVFSGNFTGDKNIESKTSISVVNPQNGYSLKNIVKANGDASIGAYLSGLLINEIIIQTDGSFSFMKQNKEIARISESGFKYTNSIATTSQTSSIYIYGSNITNSEDTTDDGAVNINTTGYIKGTTKYRNFNVYDGKNNSVPLFEVIGKSGRVNSNALLAVINNGKGLDLVNPSYTKVDTKLTNALNWKDGAMELIASVGFITQNSYDFTVKNVLGNIIIHPKQSVDITGELKINGTSISTTYVSKTTFDTELKKKVSVVTGKQLSTEDFTTAYKTKLDSISQGNIGNNGTGFVTAKDVTEALSKKLSIDANLSDLKDKKQARTNLDVYSKGESNDLYLKKASNLLELVTLTADEVNGLTTEQITAKKEQKQSTVRNNIDAEKKGVADLKLAKASNLSDLSDKSQARKNLGVYSIEEIEKKLEGKLSTGAEYTGAVFTTEHKTKLEGIKTGIFAGTDSQGKPISQVEGYVMTSSVLKELSKKANHLMDGYSDVQKNTIATNLGIYTKVAADNKFALKESLFQDYITFLAQQGKTTQDAQQILRDKLNSPSKEDVSNTYLRKDGKLSDLTLTNADAKKAACRAIGAAYSEEYQTKLLDTGWLQMSNSGGSTDTRRLFIRQIGNVVCIQGIINTAKRDGSNWGGTVAIIPNTISPPQYGLRASYMDYNDDHKYNRGTSFKIFGNSRNILIYESGMYNADTELNFTYMI